jgi:hypothetical protein
MPEIKERPILFSAPMVRAILEGRKTVTRRVVNPQPVLTEGSGFSWKGHLFGRGSDDRETSRNFSKHCCPYGKPGDRMWVRETWTRAGNGDPSYLTYRATYPDCLPPDLENIPPTSDIRWKPSIHMFRRDSRILLEITAVRVERLQDISRSDIRAEGLECPAELASDDVTLNYRDWYPAAWRKLWKSTGGNWDANPWVWVVEFKKVTP